MSEDLVFKSIMAIITGFVLYLLKRIVNMPTRDEVKEMIDQEVESITKDVDKLHTAIYTINENLVDIKTMLARQDERTEALIRDKEK